MNNEKKAYYKKLLLLEKTRLGKELKRFSDEEKQSLKDSTSELSSYDNHPADQATDTYNREVNLGIKDNVLVLLKKVEEGLIKIESDRYGICQRCGEEIKESRLELVPYTEFCERCKKIEEDREGVRDRPLEEENLYPPFGRGYKENLEYDAEDAWQDVAQYGTSSTPQDEPEQANQLDAEDYIDTDEKIGSVTLSDTFIDEELTSLEEKHKRNASIKSRKKLD